MDTIVDAMWITMITFVVHEIDCEISMMMTNSVINPIQLMLDTKMCN
jgi:hypothetical protein